MKVLHYTLTLTGSAQVLGSAATQPGLGVCKQIQLHADSANAGVIYVGGVGQTLSNTAYGIRIEIPVTTIPPAPSIIEAANMDLNAFQVLGTNNDKLHVLALFP